MSNLTAQEMVYSIPLGRRIGEIMEEKGSAFTIRAFANRLNMNREILRNMIQGSRTITPSELELIAEGLHVRVERIKRMDTYSDENELNSLLQSKHNLKRALILATELVENAIGLTERCLSLHYLGKAYFELQNYDDAHRVWFEAYEFAQKIFVKYNEKSFLSKVLMGLMITYTIRKEFTRLDHILSEVEEIFYTEPKELGIIFYTKAKVAEQKQDRLTAKKDAYRSLEAFLCTHDKFAIGKAEITAAHYEYLLKNFYASKELLERAIDNLEGNVYFRLMAVKEYSKTLLKLKHYSKAIEVIKSFLSIASDYPLFKGKLKLLLSIATGDISYAESVTSDENISIEVRYLACKYLMNYYKEQRDATSLLSYYEKADTLSPIRCEILDEEGL